MRSRWTLIALGLGGLGAPMVPAVAASDIPAPSSSVSPQSTPPFKVFSVYTERGSRLGHYSPSGYMGDMGDLTMSGAYLKTPIGNGPALRINYRAKGPKGWAGIYWQDPPNNWGTVQGRAGYDLRGATRLTFWARGEEGGERIHEFRIGGVVGAYPDSDVATLTNVRLTKEWKQYTIDLSKKDLRHIIAGFGFSVLKVENSGGMQFYIDEVLFEGPQDVNAVRPEMTSDVTAQSPAQSTAAVVAAAPVVPATPPPAKDLEVKEVAAGLKVSFSSRLMFLSGQAVLDSASHKVLDQLHALLSTYPANRILVEGHTDSTGDKQFNLRLSELRARAVRDYLIKRGGFESSRFQVVGYGDTKPMATNSTRVGRSLNRRVEVTILKIGKQ